MKAAKLIEQDPRVKSLGLCNFDTQRMDEVLENGVKIVSNQVQVSMGGDLLWSVQLTA